MRHLAARIVLGNLMEGGRCESEGGGSEWSGEGMISGRKIVMRPGNHCMTMPWDFDAYKEPDEGMLGLAWVLGREEVKDWGRAAVLASRSNTRAWRRFFFVGCTSWEEG